MNELEMILRMLNSKIHKEISFSPDDLDRLTEILSKLVKINSDIKELRLLDDATLDYLLNKKIIEKEQFDQLKTYRYKTYEQSSTEELNEIINKAIYNIMNINQEVENKDIKELINVVENKFHNITEEQLDLLLNIISNSNYSIDYKRDLLLYVSLNSIKYEDELVDEEYESLLNDKGMTEEQCIELFDKYGYDFDSINKSNKAKFLTNGIYEKVDTNFKILQDNNINLCNNCGVNILLKKQAQICEILVKGNSKCIQGVIDTCIFNSFIEGDEVKIYYVVSEPSNFILKKRKYRARNIDNSEEHGKIEEEGSYQDFTSNAEYFTSKCNKLFGGKINFLNTLYEKKECESLLSFPHQRILEYEKILKAYGFSEQDYFEAVTRGFSAIDNADILDIAVELDVLDYVKKNRSKLTSLNEEMIKYLYVASLNKSIAFIPEKSLNFADEIIKKYSLNISLLKDLLEKTYIPEGIESMPYDKNLHSILEGRVASSDFDINTSLEKTSNGQLEIVKILEDSFKKDDLVYEINGIRVSRNKVLRIFNAISSLDIDYNKQEYPILRYALTRNSFLTKEQIISLMDAYHKVKEEMKVKNK